MIKKQANHALSNPYACTSPSARLAGWRSLDWQQKMVIIGGAEPTGFVGTILLITLVYQNDPAKPEKRVTDMPQTKKPLVPKAAIDVLHKTLKQAAQKTVAAEKTMDAENSLGNAVNSDPS